MKVLKILILEDEINVLYTIIKYFYDLDQKTTNKFITSYFSFDICQYKIPLQITEYDIILIDRDNLYSQNFHTIFFYSFKNIKNIDFNKYKNLSKKIYLISGSEVNNKDFINKFIKFWINNNIITNIQQQKEIEKILEANIYTKSLKNYLNIFKPYINKIVKEQKINFKK